MRELLAFPAMETTVSLVGNSSIHSWKLQFPTAETGILSLGTSVFDAGYCAIGMCCRYLYLPPICNGICNAINFYMPDRYLCFVADGRYFFISQTL